jgi:putative hydrolase of the HAD superfamily
MRASIFEAIVCDYGNVLARTLAPEPRAAWERRLGLAAGALERVVHNDNSWIAAQRGQITPEAHWHEVGTHLGLTPCATAALRAAFYQGDVLNAALVARLAQLRSAGTRLALLSNFSSELNALLVQHDLSRHFDHIVVSADVGVMKPDAEAYRAVLHRLALPAHRCVFIDDLSTNVEAARLLGMHGILFRDTPSCLAELDRLGNT